MHLHPKLWGVSFSTDGANCKMKSETCNFGSSLGSLKRDWLTCGVKDTELQKEGNKDICFCLGHSSVRKRIVENTGGAFCTRYNSVAK